MSWVPEGILRSIASRLQLLVQGGDNLLVLKTSLTSLFIRAAGVALVTIVTVLFTRIMGAEEYGKVAFLLSGGFILVLFSGLGLPTASSKLVPRYLSRGQSDKALHYFVFGLALLGFTAVAVGFLFHLTLVAFPSVFAGFAFSFSGTVGLLVTLALMRFVSETSRAFGFQVLGFAAESVISRVILLAVLLLLLGIGVRLDASVALQLYVVAQAATVVIVIGWMLTHLRPDGDARRVRPLRLYRAWLATASVMLVTPVFYFLLFETDVMALGILSGPYEVGVYQVARRLAELTVFCSSAVSAVALPRLARAHAERDVGRLQSMTDIMNLMAVTSTLVVAAALILLGPWGLWIFGPEFDAGYPALVVLAVGRVLTVLTGPGSDLLLMTGHHRLLGRVNLWFGLANVALNVVLVPTFGALGAAIATALASGGWSLWLYVVVRRVSPIEPCVLRRLWRALQVIRVERQG